MSRDSELERAQRLLRRLDLEEVLDDLGIDVLYLRGSDAYAECPDPDHEDSNPSFHVCVEDVTDSRGRSRIGAYNCWSHPGDGLRGLNFLDLAARVLFDVWGEDEDGRPRYPGDDGRTKAAAWLRERYLSGAAGDFERLRTLATRRRRTVERGILVFPPGRPIGEADPRFQIYLDRRGVSPARAGELGVLAVQRPGSELKWVLEETCPAVLFPIRWDGEVVNWYARAISHAPSRNKGRYAPGIPLGKVGVLWLPDEPDLARPIVLVEGIFDAERTRSIVALRRPEGLVPGNVGAVLGGRISPEQARRLRAFPRVIHLGDGDAGGDTLAESIEEHLGEHTDVVSRRLPDGTDPGDAPIEAVLEALTPPPPRLEVRRRIRRRRVR